MSKKIPKKKLLPVDELNAFAEELRKNSWTDLGGKTRYRKECEDIIDEMLDLFLLAYAMGEISADDDILSIMSLRDNPNETRSERRLTTDDANRMIDKEIAGKMWSDRVREHYNNGDSVEDIIRVADTEMIRDFNGGAYDAAKLSGVSCKKKWIAILDERTRDSHYILSGTVVGIDEKFNSISGDSALYPGGFATPEENCNCRCGIEFID